MVSPIRISVSLIVVSCSVFLSTAALFAGTISGKVTDALSNESLPGAKIAVVGKHKGAIAGLDGSYKLPLSAGDYQLKVTYDGYVDSVYVLTVTDQDQTFDIAMQRNAGKSKEVTVKGKTENGSEASSLVAMRASDNVINAVSARTIEISPDISVADVSQRLSGVSTTRTVGTGDAQYAIIRGMDKRYNYTTINGVKIPSPDNKNNYVPLDIFPAELVLRRSQVLELNLLCCSAITKRTMELRALFNASKSGSK